MCVFATLVLYFNIIHSKFQCGKCQKWQKCYTFNARNNNEIKQCTDNINNKCTNQCTAMLNNNKYTLDMMIDEFGHETELINGESLRKWFNNILPSIRGNYDQCLKHQNIIKKMTMICKSNIKCKKQTLAQVIHKSCINEYILHAPIRQLQLYDQISQCISKIHESSVLCHSKSLLKICILCNKEYPIEILLCMKYCGNIHWENMTQSLLNDNIFCSFCLRRHEEIAKIIIGNFYNWSNCQQNNEYLIKNINFTNQQTYVCWWDFSEYMWRYAKIQRLINSSILTIKIKIVDTDSVAPATTQQLCCKYFASHTYFIIVHTKQMYPSIPDAKFEIDANNEHMLGWTKFSNIWKDNWQIPVKMYDNTAGPVYFQQIGHSVKLYNWLCENNIL